MLTALLVAFLVLAAAVVWSLQVVGHRRAPPWFVLAILFAAMPATAQRTTPNRSVEHVHVFTSGSIEADATNALDSAESIAAATASAAAPYSMTIATTTVPGVTGRNITLTTVDAAAGSPALSGTAVVYCNDQFGVGIQETFTLSGSSTVVGTKICATSVVVKLTALAGNGAGDTLATGIGDVVGLPFKWSPDRHEIKVLQLVDAAGTTITPITINSTNLDSTNFACKASCFASSDVVDGDRLQALVITDDRTPDNRYLPQR